MTAAPLGTNQVEPIPAITVKRAAQVLDIGPEQVRALVHQGRLVGLKRGRFT